MSTPVNGDTSTALIAPDKPLVCLPKKPNGEPFSLSDFIRRTEPHSQEELSQIERLLNEYDKINPLANSITLPTFPDEPPMTDAEQFRQRLLGQYPWMFGFHMGRGKHALFLSTRFTLLVL